MSTLAMAYLADKYPDAFVGGFLCVLVAIPVGIVILVVRDKFSKGKK